MNIEPLNTLTSITQLFSDTQSKRLSKTLFVCVQHLLYTTVSLIDSLIQLGARAEHIHIMGKIYSSNEKVIQTFIKKGVNYYPNVQPNSLGSFLSCFEQDIKDMWEKICKNIPRDIEQILVMDDGGKCILHTPVSLIGAYPLIGVEQTASGLTAVNANKPNFPIIDVASSAAKQLLEADMIAEAVIRKIDNITPISQSSGLNCGVVGLGVIGKAVTKKLLSLGHKVITYDKNEERNILIPNTLKVDRISTILKEADYVFGCTGEDITINLVLNAIDRDKTFISCSSQDNEFLTLLKLIQAQLKYPPNNVLENIEYKTQNGITVTIFRGGFPINLDNSGESVVAEDIQLTRGLLLGAMIQGIILLSYSPYSEYIHYMLNPTLQRIIIETWMSQGNTKLFDKGFLDKFRNDKWIKSNSGGIHKAIDELNIILLRYNSRN